MDCAINEGMILRTVFTYYFLKNSQNNLLYTPLLLTGLDLFDNVLLKDKKCTKTFNYQMKDKAVDVISYIMLLYFYDFDKYLKYFVIYRLIGVTMYILTRNSDWLIIFFDFVKEYMIYRYIFGENNNYLLVSMIGKILFEIFYHKNINGGIKE